MPKYFDIHSHLNFSDYQIDFDEVIERLRGSQTHTIVVGTDFESSKRAVELADKYPEIYACIGIHPIADKENSDISLFSGLVKHPKVVMIGECGLDFYHADKNTDFERQKKLFIDQIRFALTHKKSLMIHSRDAYGELLEILKLYPGIRGNIHFFAGDWEIAQKFFAIGFTISFTGVITFASQYDQVIKNAPLDKILSETDAPYVAPVPYRGKRNEPSYVSEVAKRIAEVRGSNFEEVRAALFGNALSMIM